MNRALFAAASGMAAQQQNLEVIAENLANADVAGFKGAAARFSDIAAPGGGSLGTATAGVQTMFAQGKLMHSGGPFDVAIQGAGFFPVVDAHGAQAYTRDGEFSRGQDGRLRNAQGWRLESVRIPDDAVSVSVGEDGIVSANGPHGKIACGRIRLAEFAAPEFLRPAGGTLFFATHESGKAHLVEPRAGNEPSVKFNMLERSNVTIVDAMMQILAAQRAYEANAKGVQAADEMLRIANNLQRG